MRNKVRKSLAFLLALALVVSVMSGLGLSVSAEQESNTPGTEEVQQQDKTEAGAAPSEVNAEEEAAKPKEKPVLEEKKDEQKKQEETKTDDAAKDDANAQDGDQKDEPQAEPAAEEPAEPVEQASVPIVQAAAGEDSQYTITCGDQRLTVKLVDTSGKMLTGIKPNNLEIRENTEVSISDYVAEVDGYSYSYAYYNKDNKVSTIIYCNNYYTGWYSVGWLSSLSKISKEEIYLVYEKNPTFTVHYVDESGNQIAEPTTKDAKAEITFKDYMKPIDGYTYWRACYSTANNAEITKAEKDTYYNRYTFYNGSEQLKSESTNNGSDESINKLEDIYLVYVKDGVAPTPGGTTGGSGSSIGEPSHTKKAVLNGDGTYDLRLDVSASVGTATSKAILDVVFILDTSGSMEDSISGSGNKTKIKSATDAIKTMVNSLAGNKKIDASFSLITFAKQAKTVQNWTPSADTLNGKLPQKADGGTNYQDAFIKGKTLLGSSRTNATRVVVFVSDGNPTYYMSANGNDVKGTGNSDGTGRGMSNARGVVKTMLPNYLFTVGVGDPEEYSKLSQITDAAHPGVMTKNYEGTSTDTLKAAFNDMEGQITSIACEKVTISDKLSANVAMVLDSGKPKKLKGEVTDKNGKLVGTYNSADGSIALPATDLNGATTLPKPTYENGEIVWNLPDDYKLEAGYTYTVTANVDVTETAFKNYRTNNGYPVTADAGTGTHENQKGLFSNDNNDTKLTYTVTGDSTPKTVNYPKPVVQLTPSKLTIKKTVNGLDETALEKLKDSLKFKVTYTYKDKTTTEKEISFKDFTLSDDTYSYTSDTLDCWSMDATYTVVEEGFEVEGYDRTGTDATTVNDEIKGKNQNKTATFTNSYTPSNRTITLKKVVAGNMGDKDRSFTFSATKATLGETSLKDSGTTTITAKVGETVTITEKDYTADGYTTTASATDDVTSGKYENHSYTFTVTKDMSTSTVITFTNTKTIQPPNGITTTIAPYAIMVVLAAGAGVYFVYSRRRRNR